MSELVIEYLIYLHLSSETPFLDSENSFRNFLAVNSKLIFEKGKIQYKDILVGCKIKISKDNKSRFFNLKIIYKKEDVERRFESCLKLKSEINTIIYFLDKVKIYTLWDDLSFDYSKKAYPLIYEVENLMRKLITKFMVINVGAQWAKSNLPDIQIRNSNKNNKTENSANDKSAIDILYRLDFKDLTDVLLKPYKLKISEEDTNKIYQKIIKAGASNELDINDLKNIVPQSNWQRFFSSLIEYDSAKLENTWSELYELRCKVAHNNFLDKGGYDKIINLTEELKNKLTSAIEKLDDVKIPEEDKGGIRDIIDEIIEESDDKDTPTTDKNFLKESLVTAFLTSFIADSITGKNQLTKMARDYVTADSITGKNQLTKMARDYMIANIITATNDRKSQEISVDNETVDCEP